jgi:hypothetical protein
MSVFAFLIVIVWIVFGDLFKTFFQQDEWYGFGKVLYAGNQSLEYYFTSLSGNHINPFSVLFFSAMFHWFGLNAVAYNVVDIVLHILNVTLIYWIAFRLMGRIKMALLASFFFLVSSVSIQAVVWVGAATGTLWCAFFALVSLLSFTYFATDNLKRYLWLSLIFFAISLGFQEQSIFFVGIFPLLIVAVFSERGKSKQTILALLPFLSAVLLIGVFRLLIFIVSIIFSERHNIILQGASVSIMDVILRFFLYPLEGLSQVLIPYGVMYRLQGLYFSDMTFWNAKQLFGITSGDWLSVAISVVLLISLFFIGKYFLNLKERRVLVFSVLFALLSFIPYIIVGKGSSYLDSRYYYFASTGAAIIFMLVAFGIARWGASFVRDDVYKKNVQYILLAVFAVPYLLMHVMYIQKDIAKALEVSFVRKKIINSIEKLYPSIGEKTIFYTESDTAYYGLADKILPFQSGPGQMLMVLYAQKGQLNPKFFRDDFLWGITDQGYSTLDGQGFGYFRDIQKLRQTLEENNLSVESVFAFSFQKGKVKDISNDIRRRVSFSSDEEFIKNVLYKEKALGYSNDRIVYFNLKNTLSTQENELIGAQSVGGNRDRLYTARSYTHVGWVGANLVHYQDGFDGNEVTLPRTLYGYDIVSIGSVVVNGVVMEIKSIRKMSGGDWTVLLDQDIKPSDVVEFGLWVAVHQVDITGKKKTDVSQYDFNDIRSSSKTTVLQSKAEKKTNIITLRASGKVGSLPMNDKRKTIVFVNGIMTEIKSVTMNAPNILSVVFNDTLSYGDMVDVPVFVETPIDLK